MDGYAPDGRARVRVIERVSTRAGGIATTAAMPPATVRENVAIDAPNALRRSSYVYCAPLTKKPRSHRAPVAVTASVPLVGPFTRSTPTTVVCPLATSALTMSSAPEY